MKWLLAIPHYIVLVFLGLAAIVVVIVAWFADSVHRPLSAGAVHFRGGRVPLEHRVAAYACLLVTDRYPPFRLSPEGGGERAGPP